MNHYNRPSIPYRQPVCRYYNTVKGCYAGASCKFLHSEEAVAPPLSHNYANERCKFFAAGYCHRGKSCWFRHEDPFGQPESSTSIVSKQEEDDERSCTICMEVPSVYGLLTGCSHVFCLPCLKSWRDPHHTSSDIVGSGVHKQCPICRTSSKFVTPSSIFYKSGDPKKDTVIERYKESMKRIKCRYFEGSPANRRYCPFGKDCFYKHVDDDGKEHVFEHGYEYHERRINNRRRRNYPHRDNVVLISDSDEEEIDLRPYDLPNIVEALLQQMNDLAETEALTSSDVAEHLASLMNHILDLRTENRQDSSSDEGDDGILGLEDQELDPILLLPDTSILEETAHAIPQSPSPQPALPDTRHTCVVGPPTRRRSGYMSEEPDVHPSPPPPANWEDESDDELLLRPSLSTPASPISPRVSRHRRHAYSVSSAHPPLAPLQLSRLPRISDLPSADEKERTELIKSAILASSPEASTDSILTDSSSSPVARKLDSCQSEFEVDDEDMEELVRSVHKTLIGQSKG